jgi:uncharacterized protein (UPF0147 family)
LAAFTNKGPYKKPKREIAKRDIRRLIVEEGLTNNQISERLNVPLRTIERYISEIYEHDNQLLQSLNSSVEDTLTVTSIAKDRLNHYRQEILQNIARNPKAPFADKIRAWHLICELEAADLRIRFETVPSVLRKCAPQVKRAMMLKEDEVEEAADSHLPDSISHAMS